MERNLPAERIFFAPGNSYQISSIDFGTHQDLSWGRCVVFIQGAGIPGFSQVEVEVRICEDDLIKFFLSKMEKRNPPWGDFEDSYIRCTDGGHSEGFFYCKSQDTGVFVNTGQNVHYLSITRIDVESPPTEYLGGLLVDYHMRHIGGPRVRVLLEGGYYYTSSNPKETEKGETKKVIKVRKLRIPSGSGG